MPRQGWSPIEPELATPLPADHPRHVVRIQASSGWAPLRLGDLWHYRELIYFLAWRDIKVRYKQTLLGAVWALLQPALLMIVFTLIFGVVAKIPSEGLPYPLFAYAGLLPWQLFAFSLQESSASLLANERLISKVYFPRLIIPISSAVVSLIDFMVSMTLLVLLLLWYAVPLSLTVLLAPGFVMLGFTGAVAIGLSLAAVNVRYRDVRYTIPFLTQLWFFATPIAYPASALPEPWRTLVGLNPMAGVVEGFRWSLLGTSAPSVSLIVTSVLVTFVTLFAGLFYFRRMERTFADVI